MTTQYKNVEKINEVSGLLLAQLDNETTLINENRYNGVHFGKMRDEVFEIFARDFNDPEVISCKGKEIGIRKVGDSEIKSLSYSYSLYVELLNSEYIEKYNSNNSHSEWE